MSCAASWAAEPTWLHDCFLDMLASGIHTERARDTFVLDPEYERLLDSTQIQIKEALRPLRALAHNEEGRHSSSWLMIQKLLAKYGERSDEHWQGARPDGTQPDGTPGNLNC